MEMENIFDKLDILLNRTPQVVNESVDEVEYDEGYETEDEGIIAAVKQIVDRVLSDDVGMMGGGPSGDMEEDDNPLPSTGDTESGDEGDDKTFKSSKLDGMDDVESLDKRETPKSESDEDEEEEDFEFDDFDYDDDKKGSGGKSSSSSKDESGRSSDGAENEESGEGDGTDDDADFDGDDWEDGDFGGDDDLGDEGDYDFGGGESGDDGDEYVGDDGDEDDTDRPSDGTPQGEGNKSSRGSSKSSGSKSSSSSSSGGESGESGDAGGDDIDYDDTLDYDTDEESLESEINDALDRAKSGATNKSVKNKLQDMKDAFDGKDGSKSSGKNDGESGESSGEGGESGEESGEQGEKGDSSEKSSSERAEDLSEQIKDALDDSKTGQGSLAGEALDKTPDDKSLEEDMKKAGFDDGAIEDMKSAKEHDTSGEIDEDKVAKDAMKELDAKAEKNSNGERKSSLSRSIMRSVLEEKITSMEWREMVKVFLEAKSKTSGSSLAKGRSTSWGDKKHLWRDAILPKSSVSGGDIDEITCFIDFSGSVNESLVKVFIRRVLDLCSKLSFGEVRVFGFAEQLSKPFVIKKRDVKKDESKMIDYINTMWETIRNQNVGWAYENFEVVAKEILKIKRKDHNAPILIFGDGIWGVSYANEKPPMYLKDLCSRYLKDILVLVYYDDSWEYWVKKVVGPEVAYLKQMVGIKHLVTTAKKELRDKDIPVTDDDE